MILTTKYVHKAPFTLDALGLEMPALNEAHINRTPFRGILTQVDEPSTRPPNGSNGHRVMIPHAVAEEALPTLLGMAVDLSPDLREHDHQTKIGIVTSAEIAGKDFYVAGHLYEKDFPKEVARIKANLGQLGMSYEISDVDVDDPEADIWVLNHFVFTGAAILRRDAAAYANTAIAARAEEEAVMPDERSKILDELAKLSQQMMELKASGASEEDAAKMKDEADAAALAAKKAEEDAAAKKAEDDAAAAKAQADADAAAEEEANAELFAAMLRAMGKTDPAQDAAKTNDGNMMHKMLGMLMRAMVYPGGAPLDGKHDDEKEDMALIKRMLKPGGMSAARQPADLATKRLERDVDTLKKSLEAQGQLLTDAMSKMTGLITDVVSTVKGLATDTNRGHNGGPVRKTMSATGAEKFIGPFDASSVDDGKEPQAFTMEEIDAALGKTEMNAQQRMAKKLELQFSNKVKQA